MAKRERPPIPDAIDFRRNTGGFAFFDIEEYHVFEWCPERAEDPNRKPTQVHFQLDVRGLPHPLVLRLKSRDAIERVIQMLERHRDGVWPMP